MFTNLAIERGPHIVTCFTFYGPIQKKPARYISMPIQGCPGLGTAAGALAAGG